MKNTIDDRCVEVLSSLNDEEGALYYQKSELINKSLGKGLQKQHRIIVLFNWLNGLAHQYKSEKEYENAIRILNMMLALCPTNPITHNNLGVVYLELGKINLAEKEVQIAHQLKPESAMYLDLLFIIQSKQGHYTDILNESIALINKYPLNENIRSWYGHALLKLNRAEEAIEVLKGSLVLDKTSRAARILLAEAYMDCEQYEDAITLCKLSYRLDPKDVDILEILGNAYGIVGEYELAERAFRKALKLNPKEKFAAVGLLLALKKQEKISDALFNEFKGNIQTFCQLQALENEMEGGDKSETLY